MATNRQGPPHSMELLLASLATAQARIKNPQACLFYTSFDGAKIVESGPSSFNSGTCPRVSGNGGLNSYRRYSLKFEPYVVG